MSIGANRPQDGPHFEQDAAHSRDPAAKPIRAGARVWTGCVPFPIKVSGKGVIPFSNGPIAPMAAFQRQNAGVYVVFLPCAHAKILHIQIEGENRVKAESEFLDKGRVDNQALAVQ